MDTLHGIFFIIVLLVTLLGGIPAAIYFLTKYDGQLYSELVKIRTLMGGYLAAALAFSLGKYITPAFYIFVPIFMILIVVSSVIRRYRHREKVYGNKNA